MNEAERAIIGHEQVAQIYHDLEFRLSRATSVLKAYMKNLFDQSYGSVEFLMAIMLLKDNS